MPKHLAALTVVALLLAGAAAAQDITFGDDSGEFPTDGECDDPRFTGALVDDILNSEDEGTDATDCRALCRSGDVWLR